MDPATPIPEHPPSPGEIPIPVPVPRLVPAAIVPPSSMAPFPGPTPPGAPIPVARVRSAGAMVVAASGGLLLVMPAVMMPNAQVALPTRFGIA